MKKIKTLIVCLVAILLSVTTVSSVNAATFPLLNQSETRLEQSEDLASDQSEKVFHFNTNLHSRSDSIDIAGFRDWNFTFMSSREPLVLQERADTITLYAKCEGDVQDYVTFYIEDRNGGNHNFSIPFDADGSYTTFPHSFPAGKYWVYCVGDSNIVKSQLVVIFSKFDTSIIR